MKYAILFRKLIINGVLYYQGYEKAMGEDVSNDKIKIIDGLNKGKIVSSIESKNNLTYMEINKNEYEMVTDEKVYIKLVNGAFQSVNDFSEVADVSLEFYKKYHDFNLIPEYNLEELIKDTKSQLKEYVIGQDEVINKILTKIYNNQMYYNADLDKESLRKSKNNILLLGPFGTGKTTIKQIIKNNLYPIPIVEIKLTGNYSKDSFEMIKKLVSSSDGNKFLAERGIVIIDGLNDLTSVNYDEDEEKIVYYLDTLKQIMEAQIVYLQRDNDSTYADFDCSLLTFICMIDMNYDYTEDDRTEEELRDYLYYSQVNSSKLFSLGFTTEMINDLFNDEIIYMNEMTKELALKILNNKKLSPINKLKKVLEKNNRQLVIKEGFLEELAEYGLEEKEGFSGILKIFKYLIESKGYESKTIILDPEELHNLQIGSIIIDDNDYDNQEDKLDSSHSDKEIYDDLKVDLNKRTINNLTIGDTIEKIKKNVKGQDKAVFSVVNSFYNHIFNKYRGFTKEELRELKENVLLFGSTGVGKTAIVRCLANIFNIPFVREIATRYSKAGFVGEDVDSMLFDLVDAANGDVKKAENGILYIDEIDKIRFLGSSADSMAQGVQYNLLTLIEGDLRKIEASYGKRGLEFDTSNLWVIGTGAFDGIENCIKERLKKENGLGKVGFGESKTISKTLPTPTDDDLYAYGLDRQFAGRFPNKVRLDNINVDIMYDIINNSDGGYIHLIKKGYLGDGVVLSMSEEFKKALAKKALEKKQGARGIHSAFINFKNTIDRNIMNGDVQEVILNEDCIDNLDNIQYVKRK